jgi:nitric oxide reductase NorD protein
LRTDEADGDDVGRLGLLASAISSRTLQVAPAGPGEPAWTDGKVVFVDPAASSREQVEALAVQASLLAAGSLGPDVVRRLARRPALARRYLAVEGHRALTEVESLLPRPLHPLIDCSVAARADSPAASLATALSGDAIADPPGVFGVIRVRRLLASIARSEAAASSSTTRHVEREPARQALTELAEGDDGGSAEDLFSSPGGAGGPLGRLLGRMLEAVRHLKGGTPSGADATTHRTRDGSRRGTTALSTRPAGRSEEGTPGGRGRRYPEWDVHRRRYRRNWCTVQEVEARVRADAPLAFPDAHLLRRPLARLGLGLDRYHRQAQGDDIDIDAAIEARVGVLAGSAVDEAFYVDSLRRRRDLAVLLLLDVSGSSAEPAALGGTVHEHQRATAAALTVALHELGDRVALHAFRSQGRSAVHVVPVKGFDESPDTRVMRRLYSLVPGAYSRLGAAIRHGTALLRDRGGTSRPLLVVLSDGLAYDHGYEPGYGAADARRALSEARREGIGCLCLSVGASTESEALGRVFGSAAHATMPLPAQLGRVIGPLFRSALRSAELRRRVS